MKKIIALFFAISLMITVIGCDLSTPNNEAAPEQPAGEYEGYDCYVSGHIGSNGGHDDFCKVCDESFR